MWQPGQEWHPAARAAIPGGCCHNGIVLVGLEMAPRALPGALVPLDWLKRFRSETRVEIAQRLALPNEMQVWELPRDDDGPPLHLCMGNERTLQRFSAEEESDVTRDAQGFCNPARDRYDLPSIDVAAQRRPRRPRRASAANAASPVMPAPGSGTARACSQSAT
jgi:hypothetical protein